MSTAAPSPPPVPVQEELTSVPAGALLARLLEDVDVEQVSGHDTVELLLAEHRLWCRQTARFLRAVLETGLRRPFSIDTVERVNRLGEFAAEEARAALVWSRSRAERTVGFAFDLFYRLPLLGEAMMAGELDEARARAFIDWTSGLDSEQAYVVCRQLLPDASRLMVGELIDRIKRACLAVDPAWAEKTYKAAVRTRRVRGFLGPDGTGTLAGYSQPAERVVAACERIDTLARACKRAGDRREIDQIRSDLYLGMTDGTFEGLAEPEIIAHVLAHPYTIPGAHAGGIIAQGTERADGSGLDGNRRDEGGPDVAIAGGSGDRGPSDRGPGSGGPSSGGHGSGTTGTGRANVHAPTESSSPADSAAPAAVSKLAGRPWQVPELRVQLATLLGCNGEPAEVPGWGYVPAWLARHILTQMYGAEWRYAICDDNGRVVDGGLVTARPMAPDGVRVLRDNRRDGIVELAFRPEDLTRADGEPRRAATVAGAARACAPVLEELAVALKLSKSNHETTVKYAARRTPGAGLRRWIQQRDRRCVHPCCRVPATKADQDHRVGFAHGGPTIVTNLSAPCRHDHRLKDEGHWKLTAPQPGLTVWTSPLGRRYESRPPPAIPRPIDARTQPDHDREPTGGSNGQPESCDCLLTPCPHDQPDAIAEHVNDSTPPEIEMLDDGKPPF